MREVKEIMPKWEKEFLSFKGIKSTIILEGNINDIQPSFSEEKDAEKGNLEFCKMDRLIQHMFETGETKGFYHYLYCDPLFGFSDPLASNSVNSIVSKCEKLLEDKKQSIKSMNGREAREGHSDNRIIRNSELVREALVQPIPEEDPKNQKSIVIIMNLASHYVIQPDGLSVDENTFFLNLLYGSENAIRGNRYINTLILVVNKLNDIPTWFYYNNPNVRTINIPSPDRFIREEYINKFFKAFSENESKELHRQKMKFVDLTDGMKLLELSELRRLHAKLGTPIMEIEDVVRIYKYGIKDNPWEKIRDKIDANIKARIEQRVMGQGEAVDKIVKVLKRAVSGLSGMQHSSQNSKPRGIFFLAGPTGTGKTEIVKTVAEILFEDEKRLVRFDMSEYSAEHSDQKLFGAPPGYVGYDNGGQLTNAVKSNPFSILLFDEIEKAHPNIMDKFLQILEDGRMTDGQGNTVYFSETLIFFTSNVGIQEEIRDPASGRVIGRRNIVQPGEPYDEIQRKVEEAMRLHFKPEVINRLGENIIVFNYINREASEAIARSQLKKINGNIKKKKKIEVILSDNVYQWIFDLCWTDKPRSNGGRGIGNVVEDRYLNPLAEFMFDHNCVEGNTVRADIINNEISFKIQ